MEWLKEFIIKLLRIKPAINRQITIREPLTFHENVMKNQIWYRGDPAELEQFFKQSAIYDVDKARFWASVPSGRVRKIHSGIASIVIDRYRDMIVADMDGIDFGETKNADEKIWEKIIEDCCFDELIGEGISGALSSGDGAFKISIDGTSSCPVIEFYEADKVQFIRSGRKTNEIKFYTTYHKGKKEYQLEETYGIGYVRYKLFTETGKEVPIETLEELKGISDAEFDGGFIMAVPFIVFPSSKWKGRGKALFETKTDNLDALDEVISQWLDAVRMGRVKRYIPEDMVPRDPDTGKLIEANPFDNDYIAIGTLKTEGETGKIDISQPQISYEAYVNSYSSFLDLVLQGIISPATLGIDLKKTDNGEAQREKEKITLYTRGKIVEALTVVLPDLAEKIMKVYDLMHSRPVGDYEASVKFGEYASPDFDSTVETVVKAKAGGVMSIEQSIEEMYGDTWTKEEKEEEITRLKAEQGIADLEEPSLNMEGLQVEDAQTFIREEAQNASKGSTKNIRDEQKKVSGAPGNSSKATGAIRDLRS